MGKSKDSNILLYCFYVSENKIFDNFLFYNFSIQNNLIYEFCWIPYLFLKFKKIWSLNKKYI